MFGLEAWQLSSLAKMRRILAGIPSFNKWTHNDALEQLYTLILTTNTLFSLGMPYCKVI